MAKSIRSAADMGQGLDANAVYSLGSSQGESARLQRQADELAPDSRALLDRVGLRSEQSAIDLGCGPRGRLAMVRGHPWRVMATARWRAIVVMVMDVFVVGVLAAHGGARAG